VCTRPPHSSESFHRDTPEAERAVLRLSLMDVGQIRIRRVSAPGWLRRRTYEIEYPSDTEGPLDRERTRTPASGRMYDLLGVGDAWSIIDAADQEWNGSVGEWVQFIDPDRT
jgi:hypothetical protein